MTPISATTPNSIKNGQYQYQYMRSTSSPDSSTNTTTTTDPMVNSLMQELRSMKITSGVDACSKSGDSGFLSSGDSSVNGDACSSSATSVIMKTTSGTSGLWGSKTIWGATNNSSSSNTNPGSSSDINNFNFSINNSKESIWSAQSPPLSGNSLWETNNFNHNNKQQLNNNVNNTKSQDNEWLGSIWMIPQTPQNNNNNHNKISSYTSKLNAIWDTPDSYQNFKSDLQQQQQGASTGEFQLLRPHDIGRNMWNNSTAAAVMSNINKNENSTSTATSSVSSIWATPTPTLPAAVQKPLTLQQQQPQQMRINPIKNYPIIPNNVAMSQQQTHIMNANNINTNIDNGIIGNHQQNMMQPPNCYSQLFTDDFLNNYLNMIN
uniref:CSON003383 protein n=1 Tax=Culicoides sonorensis TaxID=179676 RepID=A0A336LSP3_CULSO